MCGLLNTELGDACTDVQQLAVWLTLPIASTGLTEDGTNTVAAFLDAGVYLAGINAMTMNLDAEDDLAAAAEESLTSLHRQLGILYDAAGMHQGPPRCGPRSVPPR